MSIMDLKHKGITWVGSFYQKFEAMCQDMDDIVSKDTVKFVETQLQNVGGSVKKFCSDVVQDVLPPLVDPVKREAQAVALKSNAAINTYINSVTGTEVNSLDNVIKQSHVEPNKVDHVKDQAPDAASQLHLVNQITTSTSVDSLEEAETNSSLQKIDDVLTNDYSNVSTEENATEEPALEVLELISPGEQESFEASLSGEFMDDNHENSFGVLAKVSPASSFHTVEYQEPPKIGAACDSLADVTESVSDVSSILTSSEMAFSVVSGEKSISEMELVLSSSRSSLLAEPGSLSGNSSDNSLEAVFFDNPGDCIFDSSSKLLLSTPAPIVSCENKEVELGLASSSSILSLESIEEETSRVKEILSLIELSGNRHDRFYESAQGRLDDCNDDSTDLDMETIELCDKVKLDESCVIVEPSELYAVSRRARKLRSYRKKIQDAFASKKRLVKEYEQLAIWYGDVDMGYSEDSSQTFLPSFPATPLDSKNLQTQHACDSGWELL